MTAIVELDIIPIALMALISTQKNLYLTTFLPHCLFQSVRFSIFGLRKTCMIAVNMITAVRLALMFMFGTLQIRS